MKTLTPKRLSLGERTPNGQRQASPGTIRISGLKERLEGQSPASRLRRGSGTINQQILTVQDRMTKTCERDERKFDGLADRLAVIRQGLGKLSDLRTVVAESQKCDVMQIQSNYRKEAKLELDEHNGKTNFIAEDLLNRLDNLRRDSLREINATKKNNNDLADSVAGHVAELRAEFNSQKKSREQFYDRLIDKMGSDILKLNRSLAEEQRERQDSHADILRGIKSMRDRFVILLEVVFV